MPPTPILGLEIKCLFRLSKLSLNIAQLVLGENPSKTIGEKWSLLRAICPQTEEDFKEIGYTVINVKT